MAEQTITVNGTLYDAVTGMPIEKQAGHQVTAPKPKTAKPSHHVHRKLESARTANRRAPVVPVIQKRSDIKREVPITATKSPAIARFAPHPVQKVNRPKVMSDIKPAAPHPIAQRAENRMSRPHSRHSAPAPIKPAAVIKKEAMDEAMKKAPRHATHKAVKQQKQTPRMLSFASGALSLLLLAGYLTYINLPNLTVRVAANQAGINANYPGYRPDGYRLAGVDYDRGSVSLKFAANAGPQNFTVTQQQTSWDSTAVKENYVEPNWGDDVVPYSERGLTIYAHDSNAAWVNGGILYTITGDAPLSTTQVRSIATSL